jgi:RHS repeat-associated protein
MLLRGMRGAGHYDAGSNRATMTDAESGQTSYAYDTLNRLQTLTPASAISSGNFGISYDALNRRTQMTRPNNVNTTYSYDTLSRLLSVQQKQGTTIVGGATYTYDNAGNRLSRADLQRNTTASFCYDAATTCGSSSGSSIYQLTKVKQSGSTTESYTYDAVGNRTSSLGTASYSYNSSNELTSTPTTTYTFDNNGNTLTAVAGTNTTSYAWDYENRLSTVTLPGTGGTVTLKYDPFGRRIYKSSSSGTSVYAYDGDNLVEETNSSGAVVARYAQDLNIDEPLAMLRSATASYYQADGLGSVTSLSNSAGSLAQTYGYDSFGKQTSSSGSLTNPLQYTAREFDSETNLYFYRSRYYDPNVGRFLNEDPLRFDAEADFYTYVANGPTGRTDPYGYDKCGKSCGVKRAPEYGPITHIPGGFHFAWGAEFMKDGTHDPTCCEVRQLISWNPGPRPHAGFQPPRDQPNQWYEDRDDTPLPHGRIGHRYGRRTGSYRDPEPFDNYRGNGYTGYDEPRGWPSGQTGRFRLIVVDVCNRGKTIYTSKTISVTF